MKFFQKLFILLLLLVAFVCFFHDAVLKFALERMAHQMLGLTVRIAALDLNVRNASLQIQGLEVFNPRGFSPVQMIDMPRIGVQLDPRSLLWGKVHFKEVKVYLREMLVEKNEKEEINLNALKVARAKGKAPAQMSPDHRRKVRIDQAWLKIDRVVYKDFSRTPVSIRTFPVYFNEEYKHVTDIRSLVQLLIIKALAKTTIATLTGFDLYGLSKSVESVVEFVPQKTWEGTATQTKKIFQGAENVVEKTADNLKNILR